MLDKPLKNFPYRNRNIQYRFTPAVNAKSPLVVIMHGHSKSPVASRYHSPDWNVLCPIDNFGYGGWGSWYLGENGDLFWLDALPALIDHVYKGENLYFCGSSMGGYGAILHGSRLRARAVYANIPQTLLLGSDYSDMGMKKFFSPIFADGDLPVYNDLRNVLSKDLPTSFILSGLRWDKRNYIEQQTLPFLNALCKMGINFQSETRFGRGHNLTYTTAQSISLFSQHRPEIERNYLEKELLKAQVRKETHKVQDARLSAETLKQVLDRYLPPRTKEIEGIADRLISRTSICVHSYSDIPIAKNFWQSGDQESRAWRFSMHSFAPLDALMAVCEWDEVELLVREWAKDHGVPDVALLGEFPWHDHATALRLDRLSIMRIAEEGPDFPELARVHANLLLGDEFYSKHTNHGFDQALALLLASKAFDSFYDTSEWRRVGLDRLADELNFAFNEEGVHVENSPAYHVGMTANVVRARFVINTLGIETEFDFDGLLNKALLFTAWMIGPDRRLALLGDSTRRGGMPPAELSNLKNYPYAVWAATGGTQGAPADDVVAVYPNAGYAIYRSNWHDWRNHIHLVMKSGFLSTYHRQDDDLNILLQAHGEHWLIDSGLYNHNQADPVRIYMRSALAHNVPYVRDCQVSRRLPERANDPSLVRCDNAEDDTIAVFRATTSMYRSVRITRTLVIENPNIFQLIDSFDYKGADKETYIQFHVPANKRISVSRRMARIVGSRKQLIIRVAAGEVKECKVYTGLDGSFKSALSRELNVQTASQVIVFGPIKDKRIRFRFEFV